MLIGPVCGGPGGIRIRIVSESVLQSHEKTTEDIVARQLHDKEKEADRERIDRQKNRSHDPGYDIRIIVYFIRLLVPVHCFPRKQTNRLLLLLCLRTGVDDGLRHVVVFLEILDKAEGKLPCSGLIGFIILPERFLTQKFGRNARAGFGN